MTSFNVIWQDFNAQKFESYDIMPYLIRSYNNLKEKDNLPHLMNINHLLKKNQYICGGQDVNMK